MFVYTLTLVGFGYFLLTVPTPVERWSAPPPMPRVAAALEQHWTRLDGLDLMFTIALCTERLAAVATLFPSRCRLAVATMVATKGRYVQ